MLEKLLKWFRLPSKMDDSTAKTAVPPVVTPVAVEEPMEKPVKRTRKPRSKKTESTDNVTVPRKKSAPRKPKKTHD